MALQTQYRLAMRNLEVLMAVKQTYSVRLEDEQRRQLEKRSETIGLPVGQLIRRAIADFLRQEEERDYLGEVEMRIATAINRLGRQVEKDRAEQQLACLISFGNGCLLPYQHRRIEMLRTNSWLRETNNS